MRQHGLNKGYTFNEHGIHHVIANKKGKSIHRNRQIKRLASKFHKRSSRNSRRRRTLLDEEEPEDVEYGDYIDEIEVTAETNSSYTSLACSSGVNSGKRQCCGNKSNDPEIRYAFVAGQ